MLDGTRFNSWKRAIEIALLAKNKLGSVNGDCRRPSSISSYLQNCQCCNNMVFSWILNALAKEISLSVVCSTTASEN